MRIECLQWIVSWWNLALKYNSSHTAGPHNWFNENNKIDGRYHTSWDGMRVKGIINRIITRRTQWCLCQLSWSLVIPNKLGIRIAHKAIQSQLALWGNSLGSIKTFCRTSNPDIQNKKWISVPKKIFALDIFDQFQNETVMNLTLLFQNVPLLLINLSL